MELGVIVRDGALISSLLTAWIIFIVARRMLKDGLRRVPGPAAARFTRLWRVAFVWPGNAHEEYRRLHERYGSIVRTAPNVVDISDPSVVPIIYGINSQFMKSNFYDVFSFIYEDENLASVFTTRDPEYHRVLKRPVAQKFSMTSIRSLEYLVDPCSQLFSEAMQDLSGQVVDLSAWLQYYAFDVIGAITFSKRFGFLEERRDVENVIEQLDFGIRYGGIIGQIPELHPWLLGNVHLRRLRRRLAPNAPNPITTVTKMVLDSIKDYDEEATQHKDQRSDFLAHLRQQERKEGSHVGTREMMTHLTNLLLAGSDTTAISLRAVFYYVLRDRSVYQKLQHEIDEADRSDKLSQYVTYGESMELEYLQSCIKEAMRMHPGVSYPLERVVPEGGAELCGRQIPAGTIVGVNAATIHRDKEIFGDDADHFRPERWTDDVENAKDMERHLLTFGAGARTCLGKNISTMEMGKFIPQILRDFKLEWASKEAEWKVSTYWFSKQSGILVRFTPRHREE